MFIRITPSKGVEVRHFPVASENLPILHRFHVMADHMSNFRWR